MNIRAPVGERLLGSLIERSHLAAPDDVPMVIAERAHLLGATDIVAYVVDYEQITLIPLLRPDGPAREPLLVDGTLAGRAFRLVQLHDQDADGRRRLWVPMLDGTERIGVLELTLDSVDEEVLRRCRQLAGYVADLILSKTKYGDSLELARRRRPMSLSAELQWKLLPPLTFATEYVVISGVVQPCYEVGGDVFDYAVNGATAHVAVLDAMGHGLEASLLAAVAIGAYRQARRRGRGLECTFADMDEAVARQFGPERFVTGVLGELDVRTGRLRWVNAGHPHPLLLRRNKVVKDLDCEPTLPVGLGGTVAAVGEESLEPGDRLLLYTDGVVEARSAEGEFFGRRRLAELLEREAASAQPAPEAMRRLSMSILAHQQGQLQDDATMLFVEWMSGRDDGLEV